MLDRDHWLVRLLGAVAIGLFFTSIAVFLWTFFTHPPDGPPYTYVAAPDAIDRLPAGVTAVRLDSRGGFRDADVARLVARLPGLESFAAPGSAALTDEALGALARLRRLRSLDLGGRLPQRAPVEMPFTNAGLARLAALDGLEELRLGRWTRITDAGMGALAGMRSLRVLHLDDCTGLTDAALEPLAGLKGLERVVLTGRMWASAGAQAALADALPGATIIPHHHDIPPGMRLFAKLIGAGIAILLAIGALTLGADRRDRWELPPPT